MTHSHTKGPWINQRGAIEANDRCIARVNEGYTTQAILESSANANLIAAAPDMLEALEALLDEYQCSKEVLPAYYQALDAINKAKGN